MYVNGRLSTRKYVDKDGNNREAYEIIVSDCSFVENQRDDQGDGSEQRAAPAQQNAGNASQGRATGYSGGTSRGQSNGRTATAPPPDEYDPFADE